jgi:hypothetical protein
MLIQRSPAALICSTRGSAAAGACGAPLRARDDRRNRGFGRFGIASERVVEHCGHLDH